MAGLSEDQQWKKRTRLACMNSRTRLPEQVQRKYAERINGYLNAGIIPALADLVVGFCWPYKSEFDTRFAIRKIRDRGARAALPIVIGKELPLAFHEWWPGAAMKSGVYDIPVPDGTPRLDPDVVFVPMNAFDDAGFRLGYGGGFFDRTLASIVPQPVAIGIVYEQFRLATIRPNQHDLPMDFIITETGIHVRRQSRLQLLEPDAACQALRDLIVERGLPRERPRAGE